MSTPLQTELTNSAYAGMTDQQAAATINAKTALQPVDLGDVKIILYQDAVPSAMLRIAAAAQTPDTSVAGLQVAAEQAAAYLNDPHMERIDFGNATVAAGLALLIQGGVLGQALVDQVTALANIPWWQSIGMTRPVTAVDVKASRPIAN